MPTLSEEELYARPRTLEELLPALGMTTVPPEKRAEQGQKTLMEIASMLPVLGNAMSAYDATETGESAWNNLAAGNYKAGAIDAGLTGLNAIGAVLGLPIGKTVKEVAKAGKDTVNVFVPAVDDSMADLARELRANPRKLPDGRREPPAKNSTVLKKTGKLFNAEGRLMEEIPDTGMEITEALVRPGMQTDVGRLAKHPELFDQFPHLKGTKVQFADLLEDGTPLASSMTKRDGSFLMSTNRANTKGDLAKLLQYQISNEAGYAPAVRHSLGDAYAGLASSAERASTAAAGSPSNVADIAAYLDRVTGAKNTLDSMLAKGMPTKAEQAFGRMNAGNLLARSARNRATATPHSLQTNPYPFTDFERYLPLVPEGLTPEQTREFIANWRALGSGRGK